MSSDQIDAVEVEGILHCCQRNPMKRFNGDRRRVWKSTVVEAFPAPIGASSGMMNTGKDACIQ